MQEKVKAFRKELEQMSNSQFIKGRGDLLLPVDKVLDLFDKVFETGPEKSKGVDWTLRLWNIVHKESDNFGRFLLYGGRVDTKDTRDLVKQYEQYKDLGI